MKIESKNTEKFLSSFSEELKYKVIFLYGNDDSSVNTKFKRVINNFKNNGFSVNEIRSEDAKSNSTLLSETFYASSLFGDKNVITLQLFERENDYTKILESLLNESPNNSENYLVMSAGDLDKKSSLIKLCEKSEYVASITCYEDNDLNIYNFITQELQQSGFRVNRDMAKYLLDRTGNNKQIIANEIYKITLYKGDDKTLTIEDMQKCLHDVANFDINDIIMDFCSFNKEQTFRLLDKFFQEKNSFVALVRMFINYFLQLQRMKYCIEVEKSTIDEMITRERIFWKQAPKTKSHLEKWSLQNINKMLEKLIEFEKIKFDTEHTRTFIEEFLLKALLVFNK